MTWIAGGFACWTHPNSTSSVTRNWFVGISISAVNSAVMAGNAPERRVARRKARTADDGLGSLAPVPRRGGFAHGAVPRLTEGACPDDPRWEPATGSGHPAIG